MIRKSGKLLGNLGESAAAEYLAAHGLQILARQYRCPIGEIDIVALDGDTVVFAEVKTRRSTKFGAPASAVDHRKRQKIIGSALWYIQSHYDGDRPCRFDVVEVYATTAGKWMINHIEDAFDAAG